jgi:hypothetical protein
MYMKYLLLLLLLRRHRTAFLGVQQGFERVHGEFRKWNANYQ